MPPDAQDRPLPENPPMSARPRTLLAALLAALVALPALAADPGQGKPKGKKARDAAQVFARRDANGDGGLSVAELAGKKGDPAKAEKRFRKLDANGDGKLTLDELKKAREKAAAKGKSKGKGKKPAKGQGPGQGQ
jgi:hypothetical protein